MTKQELDSFVAENGTNNTKGVDDKWREPKTAFHITKQVQRKSSSISQTATLNANTVNIFHQTKESAN